MSSLQPFLSKLRFLPGNLLRSLKSRRRRNLTPVPSDYCVLRLARPPKDYLEKKKILAIQLDVEFELSSEDKKSTPPHLSVWVESFTTPEQAYGFLQENSPNSLRTLILRLNVDEIRRIPASGGNGNIYPNLLNVVWVHLSKNFNGKLLRDRRPGTEGHSGITGLDEKSAPEGLTKPQAKLLRKDMRSKLAELASRDYRLLGD